MRGRLLALALIAPLVGARAAPVPRATLVLYHGEVRTPNGWASAIALAGDQILATGTDRAMRALAKPGARLIDLRGRTVLPGLVDSHVHPLFAGLEQFACGFPPGAGAAVIAAAVKACAAGRAPGAWIRGGNWVAAAFRPGEQSRALLDRAAPNHPVLLNDEAHHSIWVNSRALAAAGITAATPDPPGGIIERDAAGQPTGLLREEATRLVEGAVPPDPLPLRRRAVLLAANQMLAHGITAFTVASVRDPDIDPLADLARSGAIRQHVRGCIVWAPGPSAAFDMGERLIAARARYASARFSPDCVKIFLDGVPTESHTGAMLAPYVDAPHGAPAALPPNGLLLVPQAALDAAVTRFDAMGLAVKFHAAGDAAVRAGVGAIAAARAANGMNGPRHVIGHSTFIDPADVPRLVPLNGAWEFSPYLWYPTPIASVDITRAVGPARMARWMPVAEAVASGATVVAGSDWSVVPSVNPWPAIEAMVTRQRPGGSAERLAPAEAVPLAQALAIFTEGGAALLPGTPRAGRIAPGWRADLIVVDRNPFRIPVTQIHRTRVVYTLIDGAVVYDRHRAPGPAPRGGGL